jgi:hypothetical protein
VGVCATPGMGRRRVPEHRIRFVRHMRIVIPSLREMVCIQFEDRLHVFGRDGNPNVWLRCYADVFL